MLHGGVGSHAQVERRQIYYWITVPILLGIAGIALCLSSEVRGRARPGKQTSRDCDNTQATGDGGPQSIINEVEQQYVQKNCSNEAVCEEPIGADVIGRPAGISVG
jgi:hypothetical protein